MKMNQFPEGIVDLAIRWQAGWKNAGEDLLNFHGIRLDPIDPTIETLQRWKEENADVPATAMETIFSLAQEQKKTDDANAAAAKRLDEEYAKMPPIKYDEFGNDYYVDYNEWNGWHRVYVDHEMGS